jgi:hypothetical protein
VQPCQEAWAHYLAANCLGLSVRIGCSAREEDKMPADSEGSNQRRCSSHVQAPIGGCPNDPYRSWELGEALQAYIRMPAHNNRVIGRIVYPRHGQVLVIMW